MKILVTNDDGLLSDGLEALATAASNIADEVIVVVPDRNRSCCGHQITVTAPINITKLSKNEISRRFPKVKQAFIISGTPVDCVILAFNALMKNNPPDLVLSGVNIGSNTASHMMYSGTVRAAFEGAACGAGAIAFSQEFDQDVDIDWSATKNNIEPVLKSLSKFTFSRDTAVLNVNFPYLRKEEKLAGSIMTAQKLPHNSNQVSLHQSNGKKCYWIAGMVDLGDPDGVNKDIPWDCDALAAKFMSITPMPLTTTISSSKEANEKLKNIIHLGRY